MQRKKKSEKRTGAAARPGGMGLTAEERAILRRHVGELTRKMEETLLRNIEHAIGPGASVYVPVLGQCDYAAMPDHAHPAWSFVYTLSLGGRYCLEGKWLEPPADGRPWIWALAPGVEHGEERIEGFNGYVAFFVDPPLFEAALGELGTSAAALPRIRTMPGDERLLALLTDYLREGQERRPGRKEMMAALAQVIARRTARLMAGGGVPEGNVAGRMEIQRLAGWLRGREGERATVAEMAGHMHMSESSLNRFVRRETGKSPMEFAGWLRLEQARMALRTTDEAIGEIAARCGFRSAAHFATVFGAAHGATPREYRRRFLAK